MKTRIGTKGMPADIFLQYQRNYICGYDAGAITKSNRYYTQQELWSNKIGLTPSKPPTESMRQGKDFKKYIVKRFIEATGKKVRSSNFIHFNWEYPFAMANVDRFVNHENAILHCKTTSAFNYKKFSNGQYPREYYEECLHYLAVTGVDRCYLAVLVAGKSFYWFTIERNENDIAELMHREKMYWYDYVLPRIAPPIEESPEKTVKNKKNEEKSMPNRILKESICTSDSVHRLSWFEEVLFYRLIVNCDDYGRFDGRIPIINARLFPLSTDIREKQIVEAIQKLELVGIVKCYEVDKKPYLQLLSWDCHQTIRAKKSKYPSYENNCMQMQADVPVIQSEYNPNPNPNTISLGAVIAPSTEVVFTLPLNDNTAYPITNNLVDDWKILYPNVDIIQELRNMLGWLNANTKKRKTKSGILRFINSWLARQQDKPNVTSTQVNQKKQISENYHHDSSFVN